FAPDQADSALGVLERASGRFGFRLIGAARDPVFENDAGDAQGIRPRRDLLAFQFPVKVPVAAAWTDQHRRSGVLVFRWAIDADGRFRAVVHNSRRFRALDLLAFQLWGHADILRADAAVLIRSFARPKLHRQRLIGAEHRPGKRQTGE